MCSSKENRRNRFHTTANSLHFIFFSSASPPSPLSPLNRALLSPYSPSFKGRGACFMRQAKCAISSPPHSVPGYFIANLFIRVTAGIETDCNFAAFRISMFDICRHTVMSIYFICDTGNASDCASTRFSM